MCPEEVLLFESKSVVPLQLLGFPFTTLVTEPDCRPVISSIRSTENPERGCWITGWHFLGTGVEQLVELRDAILEPTL